MEHVTILDNGAGSRPTVLNVQHNTISYSLVLPSLNAYRFASPGLDWDRFKVFFASRALLVEFNLDASD